MIGNTIKTYRISQRYSQRELGELMGMTQTAISKIEIHARKVTTDELIKFSQIFGCKVTDLLKSSQNKKEREVDNDENADN